MFNIMKFLILFILIYFYDFLLGFIIFDRFGSGSLMTIFFSSIIATVLAVITTYYIIRLINEL
jgi:hypothetical protein